ncbi:MAG TPA: TIGR03936 family radical SAM-associated protein [Anaerolineae bacterium]
MEQVPRQRVRITFARGENVRYVGHLDMVRTWERILRRADVPMAYSEGFSPHPRLAFAAALPVGCTSDQEVLDVIFSHPCDLADARARLEQAVPAGIHIVDVSEVPYSAPALQTQTRASEFVVTLPPDVSMVEAEARAQSLLDAPSIERTRRDKTYDLRPLILDMWVEPGEDGRACIGMTLKAEESGTGRPDEVVAALGWEATAVRIHRRKMIFAFSTTASDGHRINEC